MVKGWLGLVGAGMVTAALACSSSGSSSGQNDSCLTSLYGSACLACLKSNCGGPLGALETGCGDYLGCICPGGAFNASNAMSQTCLSKAAESSCVQAQSPDAGGTCTACDSICAQSSTTSGSSSGGAGSSSGGGSGSSSGTSGSSGSSSGSNVGCTSNAPPAGAVRAVSLSLTGVDFGDASPTEWQGIGWNLDGKCTTAASTDVCTLASGASRSTQTDGSGGIDNSYGANICAIWDTVGGSGACSTKLTQVDLQTDSTGAGTLVAGTLRYPVEDVYVETTGAGGIVGGVIPASGIASALQAVAGCISTSLCGNSSALQSIVQQLTQAADIRTDGTDGAGSACNAISFGLRFTGSQSLASLPPPPTCPCQ